MEESYVSGTCQTMCPLKEARLRQRENLLHKFEMKTGTECNRRPEFDPDRIVKSFSRSAAGAETTNPENLRPFPILLKTVEYLYREIFPLHRDKPLLVYNFMFDRFRAVRQDAVIQNLSSTETIKILEPIVRFLIYFSYILVEENISDFDPHINNTHLQECLKRLLVCYSDSEVVKQPNRWEMESAYLLFNLGSLKALTRGVGLLDLEPHEHFLLCFELSLQWHLKNYFSVFKKIGELPPMLMCVVNNWIPEIRKHSLQALCWAYSSPSSSYPVSRVKALLLLENDSEVEEECRRYKVRVSGGKINFLKKDFDASAGVRGGVRLKRIDETLLKCDLVELLYSGYSRYGGRRSCCCVRPGYPTCVPNVLPK